MSEKPIYSPVPARAMGDLTLSAADLRVLMAVASHDRFGSNGVGCYASHARLASILSLHEKTVARSLGRLRERGYISASLDCPSPPSICPRTASSAERVRGFFVLRDRLGGDSASTKTLSRI